MRAFLFLLGCVYLTSFNAYAQTYPSKPVRIIVMYGPGSTIDIIARLISPKMTESLGQPVIVENRPGAGGAIGMDMAAKAAPDGHTLTIGATGPSVTNPLLYPKIPFDPLRDFSYVSQLATGPAVIAVHPSVPAKTLKELVALAKARPGQLNYGSSGSGTTVHLSAELFSVMTGIKMVHIPYKGASEALTALLSGQTDLQFASLSSALPLVKAGRLRAFAVTGEKRSPSIPEMPTMSEAALPGYAASAWFGLLGPAGMPPAAVTALSNAALAALQTQEVKDRLFASGVELRPMPADEFTRLIDSEIKKWAHVVKASGAKVD